MLRTKPFGELMYLFVFHNFLTANENTNGSTYIIGKKTLIKERLSMFFVLQKIHENINLFTFKLTK